MKSVAYGTFVIALMAIVSSLFFVIRKKSTGPKWIGPEPSPIQPNGHSSIADDPPPFKWSDLKYAFDIKKDSNGKEAIQASGDRREAAAHVVIGIDSKRRMFLPDLWRQQTSSNVWIESVAPALPESANG